MATLYDVVPGMQPSAEEILEAELVLEQIMQAKFPDMDTRIGTAVRDLAIRPTATIMAMLMKGLDYYHEQKTIAGITDNTPSEFLDKLLSNWFLTRKLGTKSIINARLYFARQKELSISTELYFSTDGDLKFFPIVSQIIPSSELSFDVYLNEYYYDVDLVAEIEGNDYNITSGSLLYFTNFDPYFLHAEINYLKQTASKTESNSEFIARAQTAISTRNLINTPSISSRLLEDFPLLDGVTSIGFGDAEMIRDQVVAYVPSLSPPQVLIHNGGMVDIYSRVPLTSGIVQFTTNSSGVAEITGPVYRLSRSQTTGGNSSDTIPFYQTKAVSSITRSGSTATVTTTTSHGYTTGQSVTMFQADQAEYNGTFTITVDSATQFHYTVTGTPATPATGILSANIPTAYNLTNTYSTSFVATSVTSTGTTATVTKDNHGISAGRYVTVSGATPSGYNGEVLVTAATQNTFTYTLATSLTSPATGTIIIGYTDPSKDYGFSTRQSLKADFGITQASKTCSFLLEYFQDIDGLQDYLEDSSNKVLCADYLARGYNLYALTVAITGYNGPAPDEVICSNIITEYLKSLAPGELFIMADLLSKLSAGGITSIQTPLTVTYKYYHRDYLLQGPKTGTITDYLDTNDRTAIIVLESLSTTTTTI